MKPKENSRALICRNAPVNCEVASKNGDSETTFQETPCSDHNRFVVMKVRYNEIRLPPNFFSDSENLLIKISYIS